MFKPFLVATSLLISSTSFSAGSDYLIDIGLNEKINIDNYLAMQNDKRDINSVEDVLEAVRSLQGEAKQAFLDKVGVKIHSGIKSAYGPVSSSMVVQINHQAYAVHGSGSINSTRDEGGDGSEDAGTSGGGGRRAAVAH